MWLQADDPRALETLEREHAVWAALVAGDPKADAAELSADFLGAYPDGFAGRDAHADQLRDGPIVVRYDLSDCRWYVCGPDHVLFTYAATFYRPGADSASSMLISSLWRKSEARWENVFSQDTPLQEAA